MSANTEEILRKYICQALDSSTKTVGKYAQSNHVFKSRTGTLERAVEWGKDEKSLEGWVEINRYKSPYGSYVHQGTKAHIIEPRNKKALRWFDEAGEVHFARRVHHPGYKGDPFLFNALDAKTNEVFEIFKNRVDAAVEEVIKGL